MYSIYQVANSNYHNHITIDGITLRYNTNSVSYNGKVVYVGVVSQARLSIIALLITTGQINTSN